jgi:hypothetical protein
VVGLARLSEVSAIVRQISFFDPPDMGLESSLSGFACKSIVGEAA